jgi:hypothetical protein
MARERRELIVLVLVVNLLFIGEVGNGLAQQRPGRFQRGEGGRAFPGVANEPIRTGYLFIAGKYVAPPYTLDLREDKLVVNGEDTAVSIDDLPGRWQGNEGWGGFRVWLGRPGPGRFVLRELRDTLEREEIVFFFPGQPVLQLQNQDAKYHFFRTILDRSSPRETLAGEMDWVPFKADPEKWQAWLREFDPPSDLRERAEAEIREIDERVSVAIAKRNARRRLDTWNYPLMIIGMVLVVLACGHLLTSRPTKSGSSMSTTEASEARTGVLRSLVLVLSLSGLDLVWTVLVSQAGAMRELNPLGRQLIDDPTLLLGFKALLTLGAIALLVGFRRFRAAQIGAWWACLICTLLTIRWLTLNSLFV